jgi:uncharacterized peroxidase-related enzyme
MSTIPQIELEEASDEAARLLGELKRSLGSIPTMAKAMANSPAVLQGYMTLSSALSGGVLPVADREHLALAAAEYNRCTYCLSAHTHLGKNVAKLSADEIERARHAGSSDPHSAALLALSDAIARSRGAVDEVTLKTARAAGVTDTEISEVVGNLALNILTNYFNIVAGTDADLPVVTPHDHG